MSLSSYPKAPIVVDVHKEALVKRGYRDFADWAARPGHVYVGRNMSFYVKGAVASPWANPFSAKKHGRDECIAMYREWIKDRHDKVRHALQGSLELGCWCAPEPCHADVLSQILMETMK